MRKLYFIVSLICCLFISDRLQARKVGVNYGIEWGYIGTMYMEYHYNYLDEEGSRIDISDGRFTYKSNGHFYGYVGLDFLDHYSFSIYTGLDGVFQNRTQIPLMLRSSYFFRSYDEDGSKVFFSVGTANTLNSFKNPNFVADIGYGYRIMLSNLLGIDFSASLRMAEDHPGRILMPSGSTISNNAIQLRRSDTKYYGIRLSIALNF